MVTEIQDRDVIDKPVTMPTWMTSRGFPSVQRLDWESVGAHPSPPHSPHTHKKKSLFARQCESHSPEFFGFEFKPTNQMQPTDRDTVEPFDLNPQPSPISEAPPTSSSEPEQFASTASRAWSSLLGNTFSPPSLISGEGLLGSGVNQEQVAEEVRKIHSENVQRLREASEAELQAERERVEQVLGPTMVAFLKRRVRKKTCEEGVEMGEGEGEEETGVVAPAGWVHMDCLEREKMEWMADILPSDLQVVSLSLSLPSSPLPVQEGGPVRFSLDGLVIPRGTSLPSHSALYHHGDEPAVGRPHTPL